MAGHHHVGLLTDEALLHNIAHGCEDCFDLLFLRFFRPTLSLAFKILRDRSEAEDVVQEVFLAIHQQRERFDPSVGTARTWVLQFGYYKSLKRRTYLCNRQFYAPHVDEDGDGRDPALVQAEFIQRKRLAYGTRKIGVVPAETSGQVKRKRKSQLLRRSPQIRKWCSIRGAPAFCGGYYFRVADHPTIDGSFSDGRGFKSSTLIR